jgi:hypothetical protein
MPGHGGLHPLGQRRRRGFARAEVTDDREAVERLQPEPAEDQHEQPQPQGRRRDAPGDGQAATTTTRGIGEDLMGEDGARVGLWHG